MAAISGRPDGRLAKYIYDGGMNGVIDYRLPAYASDSPEEAAKVWEKVKNGTYRGLEKPTVMENFIPTTTTALNGNLAGRLLVLLSDVVGDTSRFAVGVNPKFAVGNIIIDGSAYKVQGATTSGAGPVYLDVRTNCPAGIAAGATVTAVFGNELETSVSGNFTMTDVIGDPANILQTDALKDGWLGSWIPVIPDGTNKDWQMTRKNISGQVSGLYSKDSGDSWTVPAWGVDSVNNSINSTQYVGQVSILTYQAYAHLTKPSTNKPVLNGEKGVGSVFVTSGSGVPSGVLFAESVLGKVIVSNELAQIGAYNMLNMSIRGDNGIISYSDYAAKPTHSPLTLGAPSNNSPAVKALPYQISDNGQVSIGIQANELTYTSGSWNDDSTMKITADGSDVFNDTAGVTNLSVAHELSLPIGWSKNRSRVGTQKDGVDL